MAVLGPNGSGKTTLLKIALGLLQPTRGDVLLFGEPPGRFRRWLKVGYVPQRVEAMESRFPATVREVVRFGLYRGPRLPSLSGGDGQAQVADAMEAVGISALAKRRVSELSAGQQQRMLLARALVRRPELLLLDEPSASLDAESEEAIRATLAELRHAVTIVLVSHRMTMVTDVDAVYRLDEGRLLPAPVAEPFAGAGSAP